MGAHREAAAHYAAVLRHAVGMAPREHTEPLGRRFFECFLAGMIPRFFSLVVLGTLSARGHESLGLALDEALEIARGTGELKPLAPVSTRAQAAAEAVRRGLGER